MDYRLQRADGEYRWILECGTPHTTADGVFAGCIGSGIDVTDQKLARLILENFNHDLLDAHETERAKIARELHDDLAQRIAAVTMILYNVINRLQDRDWARADLHHISEELTSNCQATAALSHRLHPAILESLGLAKAAASFCRGTSRQHGMKIECFTEARPPSNWT